MRRMIMCVLLTWGLGVSVPVAASPSEGSEPGRIRESDRRAASLVDISVRPYHVSAPSPRSRARRHPIATAALIGGGTGFQIGYLPGDDGVFYDYTAGFNGLVVGGIGAGAGASLVAIIRALRR